MLRITCCGRTEKFTVIRALFDKDAFSPREKARTSHADAFTSVLIVYVNSATFMIG
jgi:hypothetical protein